MRPVDLAFRRVVLPLLTILGQLTPNTGTVCPVRMVGVKFQKTWLEYAKIWKNSSRCELRFCGGSLSSAASSQQAAGSGSQQLFCAQTTSTGPLQTYHRKSTISGAAGFLFINNCMCFGATKPPPTQQNVNQSRISPYESQASIGGNDGLHYPWAVGNWIHSGTADGSDIHLRLSSYTRFVVHPNIYKLLYIPSGAGFLPSTECLNICTMRNWNTPKGPKLQQKLLQMLRIQNSLLKMLL